MILIGFNGVAIFVRCFSSSAVEVFLNELLYGLGTVVCVSAQAAVVEGS